MPGELTKEVVKEAVAEVLVERVDPLIKKVILEMMTDKFEKTLGVNCLDPDDRLETRKDMEFSRKERLYSETAEGKAERAYLKHATAQAAFEATDPEAKKEAGEKLKDASFVRDFRLGFRKLVVKAAAVFGLALLTVLWPEIAKHLAK